MANTLKFGNGEWYGKKDTILAYNDENSNYKPLPFNFSRASKATVINKDGLIEEVGSGMPRIDYKDNSEGALLLEPQRSNLLPYSEDFSNASWLKTGTLNGTIQENVSISPDGNQNADRIFENTSTSEHRIRQSFSVQQNTQYTYTGYFKPFGNRNLNITTRNTAFSSGVAVRFDFTTETVISNQIFGTGTFISASIKLQENGWYKVSVTTIVDATSTSAQIEIFLLKKGSTITNYLGDGLSGIDVWGVQVEQGSYATSYIPTSGSAATRVLEQNNLSSINHLIGATQGSWFLDWSISNSDTRDNTEIGFELSSDNGQDELNFSIGSDGNMRMFVRANNTYSQKYTTINKSGKWCLIWNGTSLKLFQDGLQVYSDENALVYNNYTTYNMSPNIQYKLNNTQIFNLSLTDQEAIALTR